MTPTTIPDSGAADARGWQANLAGLLARLEYLRSELAGRRLGADATWVLDKAEAMVQAAEDLARAAGAPPGLERAEADAVARAGLFLATAQGVRDRVHKGLFRSVLTAFTGAGDGAGVGPAVRAALDAAAGALGGYFALFTDRFPSSHAARGWVDAATAFLTDFKQLVRDLPD